MVFIANFSAFVTRSESSEIMTKIKNLSFVVECSERRVPVVIGDGIDPLRIKPPPPQIVVIEGQLYGQHIGIQDVFQEIIGSIDGVESVLLSPKESDLFGKYTLLSALLTAAIVFTAVFLTQLHINYAQIMMGSSVIYEILIFSSVAFIASFLIELGILSKERIKP